MAHVTKRFAPGKGIKRLTSLAVAGTLVASSLAGAPAATANPAEDLYNLSNDIAVNLSSTLPVDHLGRPTEAARQQIMDAVNQPWVPQEIRNIVTQALGFVSGDGGEGGVDIPENAPDIAQFAWPTRADNCIGGTSASVGSAFAVPGPAALPLPGVAAGQSAFVFTALGTGPLAEQQNTHMQVQWANLSNLTHGTTVLGNTGINPDGPSTISGVANTGRGLIVAVLSGGLTTTTDNGGANCVFAPTAVVFDVR